MNAKLFIISAPSGAGKSTIAKRIYELGLARLSISHTTRQPRLGEKDGEQYFFVSQEKFISMSESGEFLEWAKVFGHFYGTATQTVQEARQNGENMILEIDWQGALQVRQKITDVVSIYICPPSLADLQKRLELRGQDSPEVIRDRMAQAQTEMTHKDDFDYAIINDNLENTVREVSDIFRTETNHKE